jgi:hypothetical protein
MKYSPLALRRGVPGLLQGLSSADLPHGFAEVIDQGWMVDTGAVLLKRFYDSYHGDLDRFSDIVGYEIAVNGRAIPDMDLDPASFNAIRVLFRRGVSFAWEALNKLQEAELAHDVAAYVTVTPTLFDPEQFTGSVTFCSIGRTSTPYMDPESDSGSLVVSLDSSESRGALPIG